MYEVQGLRIITEKIMNDSGLKYHCLNSWRLPMEKSDITALCQKYLRGGN
jgi:hypothetical protein